MSQSIPETSPDFDRTRVIERPDGFYWQSLDRAGAFGPFATLLEAVQDMMYSDEDTSYEPGESLREAEEELGIAEWIDPDTGEPAEENWTRLEDH